MSNGTLIPMSFIIKSKLNTIFLITSFSLFIVAIFYFNYSEYQLHKTTFYKQVDDKLRLSALATDIVLSSEFHDRAVDASSITSDEYNRNIDRLSKLAKQLNVIYLYTMVQRDGKIYFTASNATDEERRTGINLTRYFDRYDDASDVLKNVFNTHQISYDEYTDKWGTFRSVFIPMKSPGGNTYVITADIQTDVINQQLNDEIFDLLIRLLGTILLTLPFLTWYFRRIVSSLHEEKKSLSAKVAESDKNLVQTNLKLRAILDATQETVLLINRDGIILEINTIGAQRFGKEPEELIGTCLIDFLPDDVAQRRKAEIETIFATGLNTHFEDSWEGMTFQFYCYPVFNDQGEMESIAAFGKNITQEKYSEERIHYLSNFDVLTQLPNKAQFITNSKYLLSLAHRSHTQLAVLFLDLDHFKNFNDSLGHKVGDQILIETAKRLKLLMRESDIVARFSADEFVLLLSITDMHSVEKVAQKILNTINEPYHIDTYELSVTASLGISLYPSDGLEIETLAKNADTAMSRAKYDGRNSYRFVTEEMQTKSLRYLQLSNALRNALKNNELHVVYQPQISLHNGDIIGAEALLRWNHPELGAISPAEFIPIAEENGLILPIGEWVLHTALSQASIWRKNHHLSIVMAINLSAVQFRHPNLIDMVIQILEDVGLPPECLELELTESMAMENPDAAIAVMNTFFAHGIRMSIDDFGTGYSSLSYLKQFKISKLKIDQSFVRHICTNADDKAITNAIIYLAHSLGLQTIAEGVETIQQLEALRAQGCDEIQGYYYSKPCPADEFQAFAAHHNGRV